MRATPAALQVIVLLNIEPDVPFYPFKQRRLITRIRESDRPDATGPQRFGVFTRWTHESSARPRPRILPVYVHAKVGIVDNIWATVGSANLDGLSLDSSLPSDILNGLFNRDEQRAIEVNGVLFNSDGSARQRRRHPAPQAVGGAPRVPHGRDGAPDIARPAAGPKQRRPTAGWSSGPSARGRRSDS